MKIKLPEKYKIKRIISPIIPMTINPIKNSGLILPEIIESYSEKELKEIKLDSFEWEKYDTRP